jgi:hypothetical protein
MSATKAERLVAAKAELATADAILTNAATIQNAVSKLFDSAVGAWQVAEAKVRAIEAEP